MTTAMSFHWSPNLLPSSEKEQSQINALVQERMVQLEQQATARAEQLFQEAIANLKKKNQKKRARRQSQSKRRIASASEQQQLEDGKEESSNASDSQVEGQSLEEEGNNENNPQAAIGIGAAVPAKFAQNMIRDDTDTTTAMACQNWTLVNRKSSIKQDCKLSTEKGVDAETTPQPATPVSPLIGNDDTADMKTSISKSDESADLGETRKATMTEPFQSHTNVTSTIPGVEKGFALSNPPALINPQTREPDNELTPALLRIQQLEAQLATANELLLQERKFHRKEMQNEKEASHERMQALQLRLYIAETRLKTFEDALEQHNLQVANNVAAPTSPGRRPPSSESPQYSKVLRHHHHA